MANYTPSRSTIVTSNSGDSVNIPQSDLSRVIPRQLSTGSLRGTQTVGYGKTKIDGSNNTITIVAPDGSIVGLGAIPGSTTKQFGYFLVNANGKLASTTINGTTTQYDSNGIPRIIIGQAPNDGRVGIWVSKTGLSVYTLLGGV